jgi:hypothetical protein
LPDTPDGKRLEEVSLYSPGSLGQAVWVQRSSTVGGKGMPLRLTEYVAVPAVMAGAGRS